MPLLFWNEILEHGGQEVPAEISHMALFLRQDSLSLILGLRQSAFRALCSPRSISRLLFMEA